MKILMSAYACEPGRGSEHEVAWKHLQRFSSQYEHVYVVTRSDGRNNLEKEFPLLNLSNVSFLYYDLPSWIYSKKKTGIAIQMNAYLWEIGLFFFLFKRFRKNSFDVVQKVTFVSYRFPSFIWYFGREFVFGPVAGGERFPLRLLTILSFKGRVKEIARMFMQRIAFLDPLILLTLSKASKIIAVTNDTKTILPKFAEKKCVVIPAVEVSAADFTIEGLLEQRSKASEKFRILYVGRLLEWKGIMFVLKALKQFGANFEYEMTIIGEGQDRHVFKRYAEAYGLNVKFIDKIKRAELSAYYLNHHLLVFPSLHDSGGYVVPEARYHGLKALVLDIGGPKELVDKETGIIIPTAKRSEEEVVKDIAAQMINEKNKIFINY